MSTVEAMSKFSLLCVALVGCGDGGSDTPVDSPTEPPVDTAIPDGPPEPVTVTARHRLVPAADVRIVFLTDDDTVIDNVVTDATGTVTAMLPEGGKVVAMGPNGTTGHLWLGVEPGDQLALDLGVATTTTATITVPFRSDTSNYNVETGCTTGFASSATTTVTLDVDPGCTTTDIVVYRNVTGQFADALVLRNQALAPGSAIDASGATYTALVDHTIDVTNIPAAFPSVFVEGSLALGLEPVLGRFADGLTPVNGNVSLTGKLVASNAAQISMVVVGGQSPQNHILMRRGGSGPLSLAPAMLPDASAPAFSARTATWTQGSTGQPVDGVFSQLVFGSINWFVASPPATSIAIPVLPSELAAIDPATLTFQRGQIRLFAAPGGYDAVRQAMFALRSARGLLPADGTLVISDSGSLSN